MDFKYFLENSTDFFKDAEEYLDDLAIDGPIAANFSVSRLRPDLIIYQSGADVHVNDPMGSSTVWTTIFGNQIIIHSYQIDWLHLHALK